MYFNFVDVWVFSNLKYIWEFDYVKFSIKFILLGKGSCPFSLHINDSRSYHLYQIVVSIGFPR